MNGRRLLKLRRGTGSTRLLAPDASPLASQSLPSSAGSSARRSSLFPAGTEIRSSEFWLLTVLVLLLLQRARSTLTGALSGA
uniref:Uncharacterized protein n=1 Tax=Arundo donax TaxID=35708 RepID=A0A0A8XS59_ARUDO